MDHDKLIYSQINSHEFPLKSKSKIRYNRRYFPYSYSTNHCYHCDTHIVETKEYLTDINNY